MRRIGIYALLALLSAGIGLAVAWPDGEDPRPDAGLHEADEVPPTGRSVGTRPERHVVGDPSGGCARGCPGACGWRSGGETTGRSCPTCPSC
jgi:hypothetical protein